MSLQRLVSIVSLALGLFAPLDALAALTVSVDMGPDRVRPNEAITFEITVANNGGSAVAGVVLQAPVPAGINDFRNAQLTSGGACIDSVTANGVCDATETMSWSLGTIPAGSSATVSGAMVVAAATTAGTVLTLTGNVQAGAVTGSASVTVSADNALTLAVDENADPIAPGGVLTYTLTYGNRSSGSVTGTTLSFPIPVGTSFVSATGGGTLVGGNVQWTLGDLPTTQSDQQQVVVAVGAGLASGSVLVVDAAVLSGTSVAAETARATAVTSVAASSPLGLAVELNPDPVRPNERLTAELTVTNRTGANLSGVVLQARIPQGITAANPALATGAFSCLEGVASNGFCDPLELGSWSLATILPGASVTLSISILVTSTTASGRLLTLEALVNDDVNHQSTLKQTAAVDGDHPLTLEVDEDLDPVQASGQLTYALTYANRGTGSTTGTTLSFPIPAGTSFVSATGGGIFANGKVEWTLGTLQATQSDQQQVVVAVGAGLAAGSVLLVDAAVLSGTGVVAESARATAVTSVAASAVLGLGVDLTPDPVRPNERLTAELTVTNRTGATLSGVVLQARIPQGITAVNPALATGGVIPLEGITANGFLDAAELGSWTLGTIRAGGSITVSISMLVTSTTPAGRLLTLEALANDDATHRSTLKQTAAVDGDHPLTLEVDEDQDPIRPGGVLTYTLLYANRSSGSVTGNTLSFPVPAGTSFVSATGGGALVGNKVQWTLGALPATQSDEQQVVVAVNGGLAAGSLLAVDPAVLSGTGVIAETARATAVTSVVPSPELGLAVELSPDPVRPNERMIGELTVTNRTGADLSGVVLRARMPQGITAVNPLVASSLVTPLEGVTANGFLDASELGSWSPGTIRAGGSFTAFISILVTSTTPAGRLLTLEALVNDDATHQSTVKQTVAVDSDGPLTLAVDENLDPVGAGGVVTYALTYGNRGAASVTGTTLSFPLPAQGQLLGSTGGTVSGGRLVWDIGTVAAATGGRRQVTLMVPAGVPAGSILLANEAVLKGTAVLVESSRAVAATAVEASPALSVSVVFGRDPTQASAALTGTFSVTNNTAGTLTGVVLDARVPVGVSVFNPAQLTGGGTCIEGITANGFCDNVELARWSLGSIAPGATAVPVSMPMTVIAGMANGRLMYQDARVSDDTGRVSTQSRTALVTPFVDVDADTVHDSYDNCPFFANASQVDTDLDGRGNECECTDQNGDGRNTVSDLLAINTAIFNPGLATPLCDGNNDGKCDVNDIIAANIEIFSPTSTSTCSRYPVPGP